MSNPLDYRRLGFVAEFVFLDRVVTRPEMYINHKSLLQLETMMVGFDAGANTRFNNQFREFCYEECNRRRANEGWALTIIRDAYKRKQNNEFTSPWERFVELYEKFKESLRA